MGDIPHDFKDRIDDAVASYFIDGKFDAVLNQAVDTAIDGIIKDMFRYGALQKQIQEAIENKIRIDLSQLEIPEFNELATELIKKKTIEHLSEASHDVMLESLEKMFRPAEKEITFNTFIEEFVGDMWSDGCVCDEDRIVYDIEHNTWGGISLKIWKGERKYSSYLDSKEREKDPDVRLYLSKIEDTDDATISIIYSPDVKDNIGGNYDFEARLFLWYCAKTVIKDINKEDEGETVIHHYDYKD